MIDCGLFQGDEADQNLADFPFNPEDVDLLIVTHGHIDHAGRIPWLIAAGFRGEILCSEPTARLLSIILRDALEIHIPDDRALVDATMARLEWLIVGIGFGEWVALDSLSGTSRRSELARYDFDKSRRQAALYGLAPKVQPRFLTKFGRLRAYIRHLIGIDRSRPLWVTRCLFS